ncbi:PREDICTED: transcriptional regulator ATRX homolog isoform X2 [Nelumbo nucifera]|uniref:Transcriptional regulator ATRX homolog isoform X2 n=1 Tax=Nelumbo nucifera TaxID=4432 RepID=A0A1U8B9E2_NELNU|nr:PREDICTED: transcriptional regulator ATRX homolog isoform X2 [Nelumbo nucifera]XP_019055164.1 PREDICTED: transcriptional regulator ATRX homolog isoform X2 [Nelumbo nucifera]
MPSGPKKRKAAKKKKKERAANTQSTTSSQGNGDLKTHYEKESDSGDVSSPTSQDHHHPLEEEEEEEKKDSAAAAVGGSVMADTKSIEGPLNGGSSEGESKQKVEVEEVVEVVREFKPDEGSEGSSVFIEHVEYAKNSRDDGSSGDAGSSSSSSDDESGNAHVVGEGASVAESGKLEEEKGSIRETVLIIESVQTADALSEEVSQVVEATEVEETEATQVIVSELKVKEEEPPLPSSDRTSGVSGVIDLGLKENESNVLRSPDSPPVESSNVVFSGEHHNEPEVPESLENQQQEVHPAPPTVRPTSWKCCCGLFEVLMVSSR